LGKCCVAVAALKGYNGQMDTTLRVATKYPNIAKEYYARQSRKIQIIRLNGSIELAPCVNLSDVIVDIVETGGTLKENNMEILARITDVSARLIANKSSYQFKRDSIEHILEKMRELI